MKIGTDIEYNNYIENLIDDLENKIEKKRLKLKKATTENEERIRTINADLKTRRHGKIAKFEAKGKSTIEDTKGNTKARFNKMGLHFDDFGNFVSASLMDAKAYRLNRRINRQKANLCRLIQRLEDVVDK